MLNRRHLSRLLQITLLITFVLHTQSLSGEISSGVSRLQRERTALTRITKSKDIADAVLLHSRAYDVDPYLIAAVMKVESSFNPKAKSHMGAIGLMQLLPIAVRDMPHLKNEISAEDLWQPEKNIQAGVSYLALMQEKFSGDLKLALTAYNAGPTFVRRRLKSGGNLPDGYYQKVMNTWYKFKPSSTRNVRNFSGRNSDSTI